MGGVLAKLCKHFKCNSTCAFNKDILRIQNILKKREYKEKKVRNIISELTEI